MAVSHYNGSRIAVASTTGVVWSMVQLLDNGSLGSAGITTEHWVGDVVGPTPGTNLDLTTTGGVADRAIAVHEVGGLRPVWPVDQEAQANAQASPGTTGVTGLPIHAESYFFGALGGASSDASTIPNAPNNGFAQQEEAIGPNANTAIGHRVTTFDKTVSAAEQATSDLTYSGFTRWAGLMTTLRGDAEPAKPIQLVQKTQGNLVTNPDTITLDDLPQDGNTLLLLVSLDGGESVTGITQVGVSSWVKDVAISHGGNTIRTEIWRSTAVASAVKDVVVSTTGTGNAVVFVQEYSGVLEAVLSQTPLEQVASNEGNGASITSGLTGKLESNDQLLISMVGQLDTSADMQNAPGYLREQQAANAAITAAVFRNDESFHTVAYQLSAAGGSGDWAACIATYRNATGDSAEGPAIQMQTAEANQGGSTSLVTSGTFQSFVKLSGTGVFSDGHRYLLLASARFRKDDQFMGVRINISGAGFDECDCDPPSGLFGMWAASRVATLSAADTVSVDLRKSGGGVDGVLAQLNLVAIDLDTVNLFEGRDWHHAEDAVAIADMDSDFTANVGATLRLPVDGVSSYVVIAHGRLESDNDTPTDAEVAMRLHDTTGDVTLAQGGWHLKTDSTVAHRGINLMAVLDAPAAGDIDLAVQMIGGDEWDHLDSSITVLRLEQFFSAGFDQSAPEATPGPLMPPTAGHLLSQAQFSYQPDSSGTILTMAYAEADNADNDANGIGTQAQFPGLPRSLWDTEDTTLGNNIGSDETVVGNYDSNNDETRIPTFGVSLREGVPGGPGTAEIFNGAQETGNPLLNRTALVCLGSRTSPVPPQTPAPTPVDAPVPAQALVEKPDGQHESEALANMLEQFKPGAS